MQIHKDSNSHSPREMDIKEAHRSNDNIHCYSKWNYYSKWNSPCGNCEVIWVSRLARDSLDNK